MSTLIGHTGQKLSYAPWTLPAYPIDYSYLMDLFKHYRSPRDKISRMIKNKEIIQVKKGLYVASPEFGNPVNLRVLANLIHGPSYISLEYALSYHGLIPEKVEQITSMSIKRNKIFETPVGVFHYRYLHPLKFYIGIERVADAGGSFLAASREKAVCDRLALIKGPEKSLNLTAKDIAVLLEYDLRIDLEELVELDTELVGRIERVYRKKAVTAFYQWLRRNQ